MSTQIKERPIIFNTAMVKAILGGSKSQSRRVIKPQPKLNLNNVMPVITDSWEPDL